MDIRYVCITLFILTFTFRCQFSYQQLVINVKAANGEITQQEISADPQKDIVTIDFSYADGTGIKALLDFPKNLQVLKATILGEMERGEKPLHSMCFVLKFLPNEFISSDAMSKLRQKNPEAIRIPEEELKAEHLVMNKEIPLSSAALFSGHVHNVCGDVDKIYTSEEDVRTISNGDEQLNEKLLSSVISLDGVTAKSPMCANVTKMAEACVCRYEVCLSWYPCALKYCENQGDGGEKVSYRCGIKTCGKCRAFQFFVPRKSDCFWNTNFGDGFY